jgi:quinol monooxygenase YgiN
MPEMTPEVTDGELYMSNTLTLRLERRLDYLDELLKVLPKARALPGCLLLEVGERIDAPATFVLTERWRNGLEYANEYLALPFYQDYLSATEAMYAAPRNVSVLSSIAPTR